MNSAILASVKKDILLECEEDWVALWKIVWGIRNATGRNHNPDDLRSLTLGIVADLLATGEIEAGWPTAAGGWDPWRLSPAAVLTRIEAEWDALGKNPNIGSEIVWFTTRSKPKQ
jgi:hypothetical protein